MRKVSHIREARVYDDRDYGRAVRGRRRTSVRCRTVPPRFAAVHRSARDGHPFMDAFEQLVSEILWMEGYWVRTSVKAELTKGEKRQICRPSSPRWELDIVAYGGRDNLLRVIECKSYLDSRGVAMRAFNGSDQKLAERFKLFADDQLRSVVFERLRLQFAESGACRPNAEVKLCLACGRVATDADRAGLHAHFAEKGWELWDEPWLRDRLTGC
jgi:hypothetical protein